MADKIVLKINSIAYVGWKEVTITRSINCACGGFSFISSERFPQTPTDWFTRIGDKCTIEIEGKTVITGYIDDINISYDASGHNIEIVGRDRTSDLVDCNYDLANKEFIDQSLKDIITQVCKPFNISVYIDPKITSVCNEKLPTKKNKIQDDETVFDFISRLCKQKAILPISYGDGKLTLTRAGGRGNALDVIQLGYNVIRGSGQYSNRERFSKYIVKGQSTGSKVKYDPLVDTAPTSPANSLIPVTDSLIKRYRPKFIVHEGNADTKSCIKLGKWECSVRAGNSRKFNYTLVEWTQSPESSDKTIWEINTIVQVIDKQLSINKYLLISSVTFKYSEGEGTMTELTLVDKSTYELIPLNKVKDIAIEFDPDYTEKDTYD